MIKRIISAILCIALALLAAFSAGAAEAELADEAMEISVAESGKEEGIAYQAPLLSKVTNEYTGQRVSWNAVNGAENYRVYIKSGRDWILLGKTSGTSYLNTQVKSGASYTYTVRVASSDGKTPLSGFNKYGISGTYVAAPEFTGHTLLDGSVKLTWGAVTGAYKYRLFYKSGSKWTKITDVAATSYTIKGFRNQDRYCYTLRALNAYGTYVSAYNKAGYSVSYSSVPVLANVTNEYTGQRISWNAVAGAPIYRVYVKSGSDWTTIGNTTETSYLYTQVRPGASYTYTVRVMSSDGKTRLSGYNKVGLTAKYVAAPEITGFSAANGGIMVKWNTVSGAEKYRLFYKTGSGWTLVGDTDSVQLTHIGLSDQTDYTYTVRALNAKGAYISAYNSAGKTYRYIKPPVFTVIKKLSSGMFLSWRSVSGAAGYRVYRKDFGGSWIKIALTDDTAYIDESAPANIPYAYTLKCVDENGNIITDYDRDNKYYYNGIIADGRLSVGGSTAYFNSGYPRQGYVTVDGKTYYYNSSGVIQKDGIVGSESEGYRYADKNGVIDNKFTGVAKSGSVYWYVKNGSIDKTARTAITYDGSQWNIISGIAHKVTTEEDKVLYRAFKLLEKVTTTSMTKEQKLKTMWDYIKGAYVEKNPRIPHYKGVDWPIIYANDLLLNGVGNCMSYGALFGYLAKAIGYDEVYGCHSGGHGWCEINGLVYDPEWSRHRFKYTYYGLSYDAKTDQNYKKAISANLPWMHVKLCADY